MKRIIITVFRRLPYQDVLLVLASWACFTLAAGCASLQGCPDSQADPDVELSRLERYFTENVVSNFYARLAVKDLDGAKAYRNEVVNCRMRAVDILFIEFEKELNILHNTSSIVGDWMVLGLTTGSAVAGSAATKAVLSAIAAGITGAKLSVDKNLYYQQTMPILLLHMETLRKAERKHICKKLEEGADVYQLPEALSDVDFYYKVGTLPAAIIDVSKVIAINTNLASNTISATTTNAVKQPSSPSITNAPPNNPTSPP